MSTTSIAAGEHPVIACYRGLDSADAVQLAALLAAALGEPLVLASAYRYEPAGLSARALPAPDNSRRAAAAQAALRRAHAFSGTDIEIRERVLPSAGVVEALVALASEVDACVLVLGRDTEGHVTRSLVPRAPCPVAVAPLSVPLPIGRFERIGVAYDGSPAAQSALAAASALALATGARLVLLAAGPTAEHAVMELDIAQQSFARGVAVETRALVGDAPASLAQASDELDLLICGSRGHSRPLAAILGSVSAHLVRHARCPVLVVAPDDGRRRTGPLGVTSAVAQTDAIPQP